MVELGHKRTMLMHLTLLPYIKSAAELKTKPTQHSVKELFIDWYSTRHFNLSYWIRCWCRLRPVKLFCLQTWKHVCSCGVKMRENIYQIPRTFYEQNVDDLICRTFGFKWLAWSWFNGLGQCCRSTAKPRIHCTLVMVGKYVELPDAYKSGMKHCYMQAFKTALKFKLTCQCWRSWKPRCSNRH